MFVMKKSKIFFVSLFVVAAVVSCSKNPDGNFAQLINSNGNTSSIPVANNVGNVTCDEVALNTKCSFDFSSGRIDYNGGDGGTYGPITWTTDGTYVNWTSTVPVKVAVIVKGGNNANIYFDGCEADCATSGTALSAPINERTGKPYGLSNITFCYSICQVVALKSYITTGWAVTGGGPDNDYFIGYCPFTPNVNFPLYRYGQLANPIGQLMIGNFDADDMFEVKITSDFPETVKFTKPYLFVGSIEDFNKTYFLSYPYPKVKVELDPHLSEVIFDLPF